MAALAAAGGHCWRPLLPNRGSLVAAGAADEVVMPCTISCVHCNDVVVVFAVDAALLIIVVRTIVSFAAFVVVVVVLNALLLRGQQTSALITNGIERPCHQMSQHTECCPG